MPVMCLVCQKTFSTQYNLNKHSKNIHHEKPKCVSYAKELHNYKCLENECDNSFRQCSDLSQHLKDSHSCQIDEEDLQFNNLEEFKMWKHETEMKELCNYVVARGVRTLSSGEQITYYVCNRSVGVAGTKNKKECVRRCTKSQGPSKLHVCCISQMTLLRTGADIKVHRIKTHYGHDNMDITGLSHLKVSTLDKQQIATKLINGVSKTRILDSVRNNIGSKLKRVDLLTNKDINNIKQSYKIETIDGVKDTNDAVSVNLWVTECRNNTDCNPVLFFKQQGEAMKNFDNSDFCLVIMNDMQASLLTEFGPNIVTIDGTHGLNNYDFEMTTIMIVDEFGEGFPVAFMFTNRKDTLIYKVFFEAVKKKVGRPVVCKTFLTDITMVYYNAWVEVMGSVQYYLFCSWHVDRAWQVNLSKITNKEIRDSVYKTIKFLQQTNDESNFLNQLTAAVQQMLDDNETKNFGSYFENYYARNYDKWAYCFRKKCGINTNMRLESMHKVIKYLYLDGKCVKRLDKALHAVMKYVRDKTVDRLIKHTKGKLNIHNKGIYQKHRVAITNNFEISQNSDQNWIVSHDSRDYAVKKVTVNDKCCGLICSYCDICVHAYECDCQDFLLNTSICKHIHYVVLSTKGSLSINSNTMEASNLNPILECVESLTKYQNNSKKDIDVKDMLKKKLDSINIQIEKLDQSKIGDSVLLQVNSHLNSVHTLLSLPETVVLQDFDGKHSVTANKKIDVQNRFYSTKMKRKRNGQFIKKPNKKETLTINNMLNGRNEQIISSDSHNDHTYM